MKKVSVVLPAYNEERTIGELLEKIKKIKGIHEIIVVDDGSDDNTFEIASKHNVTVIKHPYNIGNGAAVKSGARAATGEMILLMDADNQHPAEKIEDMIEFADEYDMIVGARTKDSSVSSFRTIGNKILIIVAQYVAGRKIDDLTSGFRLINLEKMKKFLHILPNKFSYPTTITLAFLTSGYTVKYLPLDEIKKREHGKSSIKPFRDGIKFITIIFRIIMLFEPLKFFIPIGALLTLSGIAFGLYTVITQDNIQEGVLLLFLTGIVILFFGSLADQLASLRKSLNQRD